VKELVAVLPFVLVVATSFVKFAVVLAIVRRALGASAIPPAAVTLVLALLMALFVTAPVGEKAGTDGGREAARAFLKAHTPQAERQSFAEVQRQLRPPAERAQVSEDDLIVLGAAFATSELKAAFQVGFLLFLPFLVIELLCSTVLVSVGMTQLSPEAVSLPFKLLLFVVADGWHLILRGLVVGYT
jgi:type III secretion protein R